MTHKSINNEFRMKNPDCKPISAWWEVVDNQRTNNAVYILWRLIV